jgi:hypothetical protein
MSAESIKGRFARFKARPDVADVASRYGDWAVSSEGIGINLQLAMLAMQRVRGQMPRSAYRLAVRDLAATTTIPLRDFLILAECQLELLRSGLAGSGQMPFTPSEWDAEGREP